MPITLDGTLGVGTPGITLAGGAITANAAQLNSSAEDVNAENRIINGDMFYWQRATSSSAVGYVAADRWFNNLTGGAVQQAIVAFALGDTLGINSPAYHLRQTVSGQSLPAHYANTYQKIEGVRSYAGQTITVLGWAKRFSGSGNMAVDGEQNFGSGGSPSIPITGINPTTVLLGNTWAPFAVVMNIPSVATKTLGTDTKDGLIISFWTSAGSTYSSRTNSLGLQTIGVDLWGIHIRQGTWTAADAALYRPRDPGTELALCQRYYQKLAEFVFSGPAPSTGAGASWVFATVPRATPVVTFTVSGGSSVTAYPYAESVSLLGTTDATFSRVTLTNLAADAEL